MSLFFFNFSILLKNKNKNISVFLLLKSISFSFLWRLELILGIYFLCPTSVCRYSISFSFHFLKLFLAINFYLMFCIIKCLRRLLLGEQSSWRWQLRDLQRRMKKRAQIRAMNPSILKSLWRGIMAFCFIMRTMICLR